MQTATAQLPDFEHSDDKVFTTPNAVIVLDGASAFRPVDVPASRYAACLGGHLREALTVDPDRNLAEALADAITATTQELDLARDRSPSSTVCIVRARAEQVDGLVLGDTPVVFPSGMVSDDRIDDLDLPERRKYRQRLAAGSGYDDEHKTLLRELQNRQAERRNRDGGYWIAETDPTAASRAVTVQRTTKSDPWAILATDGAFNTMQHLGLNNWPNIAACDHQDLDALLRQCETWEAENDPNGQALPRSKRHDDKAIAVVQWGR